MGDAPVIIVATSSSDDHEAAVCWMLYKHQVRLTAGLLRSQFTGDHNLLISPLGLSSALSTLIPGSDPDFRAQLGRVILQKDMNSGAGCNEMADMFCRVHKHACKYSANSVVIKNFVYTNPRYPLRPEQMSKILTKYRASGLRQVEFASQYKADFAALDAINADQANSNVATPMLSNSDYATLVSSSTRTILSSAVHFTGIWSKAFEVRHGEFRSPSGFSHKVPFLYRKKYLPYLHDPTSLSTSIKINFAQDTGMSLVLILPDPSISISHFVTHMLTYANLKGILKSLHAKSRSRVALTLPQLKLSSSSQSASPIRSLQLGQISEARPTKKIDHLSGVDANLVLLQQCSLEISEKGRIPTVQNLADNSKSMFPKPDHEFTADRPFVFVLVRKGMERAVVQAGVCVDPTRDPTVQSHIAPTAPPSQFDRQISSPPDYDQLYPDVWQSGQNASQLPEKKDSW